MITKLISRFQLIRFEVIGKRLDANQEQIVNPQSFQLIRFEVIGKLVRNYDAVLDPNYPRFQLIRFEVIGKR